MGRIAALVVWLAASVAVAQTPEPTTNVPTCFDEADLQRGETRVDGTQPVRTCRRGDLEMLELYFMASVVGLATGGGLNEALDLSDVEVTLLDVGIAGALDLGVWLSDELSGGLPPGVPTAMGTGLMLGVTSGFTTWLAFGNELFEAEQIAIAATEGLAFAAAGLWLGYATRPSIGASALVRSGGLWGTVLAGLYNEVIGAGDLEDQSKTLFIGFHAGALATAILAAQLRPSRLQVLWLDLGAVVGGSALALIGAAFEDPDITAVFGMVGITTGGAIGYALGDRSELPVDLAPTVQVSGGGASVSLRGAF